MHEIDDPKLSNVNLLAERLASFAIELKDLQPHLEVDDSDAMLLLVGTFNQGLATPTSDIDLLLVYPADRYIAGLSKPSENKSVAVSPLRQGDAAFPTDYTIIVNRLLSAGQKIQTTITTADILNSLQDRIAERNQSFRDRIAGKASGQQRKGILLSGEPQLLMHRFYTGIALRNPATVAAIRDRLPFEEVMDNVGIRATSFLQIVILDLKGLILQAGTTEPETVLYHHHRLLILLASVLLASIGEISPRDKSFFQLLKRHQARIGSEIATAILQRYSESERYAREDPLGIVSFVGDILQRSKTLRPLVAAEYAEWNSETQYPLFEKLKVQ